jgi:hypothetical protein
MPKIHAYGKVFRDWESLIGACAENADLLPGTDPLTTQLQGFLAAAKDAKLQQENFAGSRQGMTQQLQDLLTQGGDAARKLRDLVRVNLGARSERLGQFGIAPIRTKLRKPKATPAPAPEEKPQASGGPPAAAGPPTGPPQAAGKAAPGNPTEH